MSRRLFKAIKTRRNIRNNKAQPPMAPTISGKNDCPLFESSDTGFVVVRVVVVGEIGSRNKSLIN